jgi:hypothetical protein
MSYRTKVIVLASTLAALLLIYAAGLFFSPESRAAREESGRLFAAKPAEVASLSLGGAAGQANLEFRRESGSWALLDAGQELPVLDSRIDGFLADLGAVKRLSPRSVGKTSLASFGLDSGKGQRVVMRAASGKVLADFTVGGYGPTGQEIYVKLGDKEDVYAVNGGFASWLREGRASWLNLKVFAAPIKPEEVEGIAIDARLPLDGASKPQTSARWSATRKDGGWSGGKLNLEAVLVESVLRSVLNLEGQDLSALPPADAFSPVLGRIELSLGSGAKRVVEIGKDAGSERFYLRAQGSPYVYLVSLYSLKNIARPVEALMKK